MNTIRRYTDLPALLYLIQNSCITLLDPSSWDDKNDSHFLQQYKKIKSLKTLLALCLSEARTETYHHWKIFSGTSTGICIAFDKEKLLSKISTHTEINYKNIRYLNIKNAKKHAPKLDELPFIKRIQYRDERELRLIYECKNIQATKKDIPIDLKSIKRITLSPWMHPDIACSVKKTLTSLIDCEIYRSTLIANDQWKALSNKLTT